MFSIQLCYEKNNAEPDIIGIKCNNYNKTASCEFYNGELNEFIAPFVIHVVI